MCLTWISTPVLPLRSLSVMTLPSAAGAAPVLVSRSSLPQATVASKKLNSRNRAIVRWRIGLSPMEKLQVRDKMCADVNNVAANAEHVCFCAQCELQLGSSAGVQVPERKKGNRIARLPCVETNVVRS